jgi:LysR family hydrogen peroxide-inducible transcriptional activator
MVTLRQLRYLAALARHRHFGRAAEACAVSQPALSVQIQELEASLGTALVERGRGRIELTQEGQEIARRALRILAEVGDLVDYARHHGRLLTGPLRLGAIPSIAPYLLPAALPSLQARHPALSLEIRETQTATLVDELLRGLLDVVVLSLPVEHPDLEAIRLFEDRFLLAAPAGHPLAGQEDAAQALLAGERLLLLEEGHCLRDQALSWCQQVDRAAMSGFGASSLSTIVQMVANGLGITLLPELSLPFEARDPRIVLLRFAAPEPSRTVGLAWRRSSPRKRDFVELGKLLGGSPAAALGVRTGRNQGAAPPDGRPARRSASGTASAASPGNTPPHTSPAKRRSIGLSSRK